MLQRTEFLCGGDKFAVFDQSFVAFDQSFVAFDQSFVASIKTLSHCFPIAPDLFVVPKGKEHKPLARSECKLMLIEPVGVVNTGDAGEGHLTAPDDVWI